jgi:hypothetical protein
VPNNPYDGPGRNRTVQAQWHGGEGRPLAVSVCEDEYGRWVVDLPDVMVLFPSIARGGVIALTREAAVALRDALNRLPLPPPRAGRGRGAGPR